MLSPLGRVPQRRPVARRRRRRRRPVPAVILLVALSVLAAVVWWRVLNRTEPAESAAAPCTTTPTLAALSLDPRTVRVRVYNATERAGLARTVGGQLRQRKFAIAAMSNDPLAETRPVQGVGELRYGEQGTEQAILISLHVPGVALLKDARTDSVVDLALGPKFTRLATGAQVEQAKQRAADRARAEQPTDC